MYLKEYIKLLENEITDEADNADWYAKNLKHDATIQQQTLKFNLGRLSGLVDVIKDLYRLTRQEIPEEYTEIVEGYPHWNGLIWENIADEDFTPNPKYHEADNLG